MTSVSLREAKDGHWYDTADGLSMPGVTTVLSALADRGLVEWAADRERELCLEAAVRLWVRMPDRNSVQPLSYRELLMREIGGPRAHRRAFDIAGAIGTAAHKAIELGLAGHTATFPYLDENSQEAVRAAVDGFSRWSRLHDMGQGRTEVPVVSREWSYGGTLDFAGIVDGFPEVDDWKTASSIRLDHILQVAAYREAAIEQGLVPAHSRARIVRLPKVHGEQPEELVFSAEECIENFRVFANLLQVWRWVDARTRIPEPPPAPAVCPVQINPIPAFSFATARKAVA